MTDQTEIRRRPDGSIDTAFYMARGRKMRSQAAHDLLRPARKAPAPAATRLLPWRLFRAT